MLKVEGHHAPLLQVIAKIRRLYYHQPARLYDLGNVAHEFERFRQMLYEIPEYHDVKLLFPEKRGLEVVLHYVYAKLAPYVRAPARVAAGDSVPFLGKQVKEIPVVAADLKYFLLLPKLAFQKLEYLVHLLSGNPVLQG